MYQNNSFQDIEHLATKSLRDKKYIRWSLKIVPAYCLERVTRNVTQGREIQAEPYGSLS